MQSVPSFLLIGDSHARCLPVLFSSSSFKLTTRAVSGLKWIDRYESKLSTKALLSDEQVAQCLSETKGIFLLVGTNSVRIMPAEGVIDDVEEIVRLIRRDYPHLNDPDRISIGMTFPCLKITRRYPTERSMLGNIDSFNEQLKSLSIRMRFKVIDFHLTVENLGRDRIHIDHGSQNLIRNTIMDHFEHLAIVQVYSAAVVVSASSAESNRTVVADGKPSQSANRSREALGRRNEKSLAKLKARQRQFSMKRRISRKWTYVQLKKYLRSKNIRFGLLPPVANGLMKLLFNNQADLDSAEDLLGEDEFDESHFEEFVRKEETS